jgi:hypothetical protein
VPESRFTPEERAPGTHWIGGWVDLRAGLDDLERRKFLTLPGLERQFCLPYINILRLKLVLKTTDILIF